MMIDQKEFLSFHNYAQKVFEETYKTGDTSKVTELLHPKYHGYFGSLQSVKSEFFSYEDSLEEMRQTGKSHSYVKLGVSNRHIRMPSESGAIVIYEKSMDFGDSVVYAMIMEVWQRKDGKWLLVREVVEHD